MFKVLKFKRLLLMCVVLMLLGVMTILPSLCVDGAKKGLALAFFTVFPSVFPFMVISRYITLSGFSPLNGKWADKIAKAVFGMRKEVLLPFVMGCISGYPTGSAVICDMVNKKIISAEEGEHMLPFCNNCSPLFVIGTVGSVICKSKEIGYSLFAIHILSAVITGMILKSKAPYIPQKNDVYLMPRVKNPFTTAVSTSISAMLNICGYVTLFSVICEIIIFTNEKFAFLCGFLEITNGISRVVFLPVSTTLKLAVISAFLGFSGICVFLQTSDFTSRCNMSAKKYLWGKVIFALISFIIAFGTFRTKDITAAFSPCISSNNLAYEFIIVVLVLVTLSILSIKNKLK